MATAAASARVQRGFAPSFLPPGAGGLEFSLRRWRAAFFLLATFVPGVWLMALTARAGLAGTWGESWDPQTIERAVALDSGNAQLRFNLGTAYLWAGGGNPAAAVRELRVATRLNPNAAAYWSALAKACCAAGHRGYVPMLWAWLTLERWHSAWICGAAKARGPADVAGPSPAAQMLSQFRSREVVA